MPVNGRNIIPLARARNLLEILDLFSTSRVDLFPQNCYNKIIFQGSAEVLPWTEI